MREPNKSPGGLTLTSRFPAGSRLRCRGSYKKCIDQKSRPDTATNSIQSIETVFYDGEGQETADASRAVGAKVYAVDAGGSRLRRLPGLEWQVDHAGLAGDEGGLATRPTAARPGIEGRDPA